MTCSLRTLYHRARNKPRWQWRRSDRPTRIQSRAAPGPCWPSTEKPKFDITGDPGRGIAERGAVAIEFAFLLPVLLLLLLGAIQFGLLLKNYVMLTNAVSVGAMQFAISRSNTTPASGTWSAITNAAPNLTPTTNITMTLSVNGTACTSASGVSSASTAASYDSACATALSAAAPSANGTLEPATVNATFPCGTQLAWLNFWSSTCQLSSTISEGIQ
jgi:Flp pilus assembly protein TadG